MNKQDIIEETTNLYSLLRCLSAIDSDDTMALQEVPRVMNQAASKCESILEALTNLEV